MVSHSLYGGIFKKGGQMANIRIAVVINRPVEDVFAFLTDPEKAVEWSSALVESTKTSEGPVGVGTTGRQVIKFLGRRIESDWELTEFEPNTKISLKSTSGPIASTGTSTFESVEGGTRVTVEGDAELGGFFRLAEPLVARMAQRQFNADYANLKDLLEAQG